MRQNKRLNMSAWRKAAGIALLAPGVVLLAYIGVWATGTVIHWSFDVGILFLLVSGVLLAASGILLLRGGKLPWLRRHRAFRKALLAVLAVFLLSFLFVESLVISASSRNDGATGADFVLIPGATVVEDRPSLVLRHRLDGAIPYIRAHPGATVIVSGARGEGEAFSEAEVMKKYLTDRGIAAKRIAEEDRATDTIENVAYAKRIMDGLKPGAEYTLMIVTNDFHMYRALLLARAQGLNARGISVPIHWSVAPICYCREYFSVMKLFISGLRTE